MNGARSILTLVIIAMVSSGLILPCAPAKPQSVAVASRTPGKLYLLPATLETTQWGWFDNAQPPILRIDSGDTVVLETMMSAHNQIVPGRSIEEIKKLRTDFPGRGLQTVTGPIYVNNSEPGDVLKVRINKIMPRAYAANFNVPGQLGEFPKEFPDGQVKYAYLDWDRRIAEFLPGIYVPLRPFPGTIGVARKETGRYSSTASGEYGGSMDMRELTEGTTLQLPVYVPGALLWAGNAHAAQGNGEISGTALDTAVKELNLTIEVVKGKSIDFPRIETPRSWISLGFDQDLNKAWEQVKAQTIRLLSEQRNISLDQAAAFMQQYSDCRISQVVNIKKGIHCLSPKNPAIREDLERPIRETAQYYLTHSRDTDLNKAMDSASMAMIKLIQSERKLAPLDAYGLASVAMDCRLGIISEAEKNVHCLLPKALWQAPR